MIFSTGRELFIVYNNLRYNKNHKSIQIILLEFVWINTKQLKNETFY